MMASQVELNSKITRGLRAQFSNERSEAILTQAESMYLEAQYRNGSSNGNRPEVYELFEGGWIDRALEFLRMGRWAIGRPSDSLKPNRTQQRVRLGMVNNFSPKTSHMPNPVRAASPTVRVTETTLQEILDQLTPDPLPRSHGPNDNAIAHLSITVFGKANTGKTTIGNTIYEHLLQRYGANNVYAVRSSSDLFSLLDNLPTRPYRAVLLFLDDMTKALEKLNRRDRALLLGALYDIRGALRRSAGMREGLVIVLSSVHRFYASPIDLRADNDLLLVRSTGTPGTFDARIVQRMLGIRTYDSLRRYETMALRDRNMLGWTGWASKAGSGLVYIPATHDPLIRSVSRSPVSSEPFGHQFLATGDRVQRPTQTWLGIVFIVALATTLGAVFLGLI
jgi:hypothetical protein